MLIGLTVNGFAMGERIVTGVIWDTFLIWGYPTWISDTPGSSWNWQSNSGGYEIILEHKVYGSWEYRGSSYVMSGVFGIWNGDFNIDVVEDEWMMFDEFRFSIPALGFGEIYFTLPYPSSGSGWGVRKDVYLRQ